jgi:5-methylthioadenosine/S-adenosylhomocysteine deaminase
MTTLIRNVLALQEETLETLDVVLAGQHIQTVAPAGTVPLVGHQQVIAGEDKLLLPGFVNGHTHSSQVWQRGLIPQLPLELWLADVLDSSPQRLEQFYWGAISTAVDTLLSGGTCVMDHAYILPGQEFETIAALVQGYKAVGIRAVIAPLIQDLPFVLGLPSGCLLPHQPWPQSTADILALMAAIVQEFHQPEAGIYIGLGPTGFHRCSDQLLQGCRDLSVGHDLCYHTHLLETRTQQRLAQERYGISAVQHLHQLGCLGHHTSLAHGVWLGDDDIERLAASGATLVHNPVSNLRLGSGLAPLLKCLDAGLNVAFGCDGAASNDAQNLLEVIKLGTILHNVSDPDYRRWLSPSQTIRMATLGGAKGVNLAHAIGTIAPAMEADLVLYDLHHSDLLPRTDPLQLLVLGRPTDVVSAVWIRGQQVVDRGQVLTVDRSELHQALRSHPLDQGRIEFRKIHQVEPHYRKMMVD